MTPAPKDEQAQALERLDATIDQLTLRAEKAEAALVTAEQERDRLLALVADCEAEHPPEPWAAQLQQERDEARRLLGYVSRGELTVPWLAAIRAFLAARPDGAPPQKAEHVVNVEGNCTTVGCNSRHVGGAPKVEPHATMVICCGIPADPSCLCSCHSTHAASQEPTP